MNNNQTFIDVLKQQYKYGGITNKLIAWNLIIYIVLGFSQMITTLSNQPNILNDLLYQNFTLSTSFSDFITKPWTLITSIFAHFSFMHILSNMLMLYFSGKAFEQIFEEKRLLSTYILGGIFGGVFEIISHASFPVFASFPSVVVGASGSVMAIFTAIAFHRPNLEIKLFGLISMRIIFLALIFIVLDLLSLGAKDGTAHFAHLGGIVLGFISIQNLYSKKNIISMFSKFLEKFFNLLKGNGNFKSKMKVSKSSSRTSQFKTDEDYNLEAKERQEKIDKILDKISKSGYESLTKAEKDFLFRQSQNGK